MTEPSTTPSIPAGWYPDPTGAAQLRWWDGETWTEEVSALVNAAVPSVVPYSLRPAPATVSAGTAVYNAFIWIVTMLPLVSILTLLTRSTSVLVMTPSDPYAIYRDPTTLASVAFGALVYASAVALSYFDRKRLLRDGFDRPFHWAWTFLNSGIYVIGRSVIVGRRAGRGRAPIWVWIAITLLGVTVAIAKVVQTIAPLLANIPVSI